MQNITLDIQNPHRFKSLPSKAQFTIWVKAAFENGISRECRGGEVPAARSSASTAGCRHDTPLKQTLGIRMVNKAEIANLNKTYRHKAYPTCVLSFSYNDLDWLGDIIFCPELIKTQAIEYNLSPEFYWARLTIHSCLHLQNFDHDNDKNADQMEKLEFKILEKLGYC